MDPSDPAGEEATTELCDAMSEDHVRAVSKTTEKEHRDQGCRAASTKTMESTYVEIKEVN